MSDLQQVHSVFDSAEAMLQPTTLSSLLGHPVERVALTPLSGLGFAGGRLFYVDTDQERLVLKKMSMGYDWNMFRTEDVRCRSITLWQYGLLDKLPPHVEHGMLAAARDGDGWAMLLEDLSGRFFRENRDAPGLVEKSLDALAHLHATFWDDVSLKNELLGLTTPAALIEYAKGSTAIAYPEWSSHFLYQVAVSGWEVLPELVDSNVRDTLMALYEDTQPLLDTIAPFSATLLHGDAFTRNMAQRADGKPVLLDWQLANCGLMTIDLAYCMDGWRARVEPGSESLRAYYRANLERALGMDFDDRQWKKMIMLGVCVQSLRMGAVTAYWWKESPTEYRPMWERCVDEYNRGLLWFSENCL